MPTHPAPTARVYGGILALRPTELSFSGRPPRTPEERLELSKTQAAVLAQRLRGKEIRTEHGRVRVGSVTEAGFDAEGNLCVRFALDDTPEGQGNGRLIDGGFLRGLSLSHNADTLEPEEVSLCFEGARPGTFITERPQDAPAQGELAPLQCIPSGGAPSLNPAVFVRASVLSLARQPAMAAFTEAAAAHMVPSGQVGMPAPGQAPATGDAQVFNSHARSAAAGGAPPAPAAGGKRQYAVDQQGNLIEIRGVVSAEQLEAAGQAGALPQGASVQASGGSQMPPALAAHQAAKAAAAASSSASGTTPADASAGAAAPAASKLARADLLEAIARQGGQATVEQLEQLAHTFIRHKGDQEAYAEKLHAAQRENEELKQKLASTDDGSKRSRGALFDNLMSSVTALVKTYMGDDALTPQMEKELAAARDQPHSLERWAETLGPNLIAASRLAARERRTPVADHGGLDPRLAQQFRMLREVDARAATEGLPSAAAGWERTPAPREALVEASGAGQHKRARPADPDADFSVFEQLQRETGPVTALYANPRDIASARERAAQQPTREANPFAGILPSRR